MWIRRLAALQVVVLLKVVSVSIRRDQVGISDCHLIPFILVHRIEKEEGRVSSICPEKSANKCRWQRRRDRPRPSCPLRVRRWQAVIALLLALARFHDPPHSSSNRTFAPRCQPQGTLLTCCTGMLPHTPTPTNTPLGDGTSLNWMPLRAASA